MCRFKQVAENKRQSQANNATLEEKSNNAVSFKTGNMSHSFIDKYMRYQELLFLTNCSRMYHACTQLLKTSLNTIGNIIKISNLTYIFSIHTQIYPNLRLDYGHAFNYNCNMFYCRQC